MRRRVTEKVCVRVYVEEECASMWVSSNEAEVGGMRHGCVKWFGGGVGCVTVGVGVGGQGRIPLALCTTPRRDGTPPLLLGPPRARPRGLNTGVNPTCPLERPLSGARRPQGVRHRVGRREELPRRLRPPCPIALPRFPGPGE